MKIMDIVFKVGILCALAAHLFLYAQDVGVGRYQVAGSERSPAVLDTKHGLIHFLYQEVANEVRLERRVYEKALEKWRKAIDGDFARGDYGEVERGQEKWEVLDKDLAEQRSHTWNVVTGKVIVDRKPDPELEPEK